MSATGCHKSDKRAHLPGCECRLKACRDVAALPTVALRRGEQTRPSKAAVLARFETLCAARSSIVQVSAIEARVEGSDGEILILGLSPAVLALLSAADRLPPPITAPGETWGAERVTGGAQVKHEG